MLVTFTISVITKTSTKWDFLNRSNTTALEREMYDLKCSSILYLVWCHCYWICRSSTEPQREFCFLYRIKSTGLSTKLDNALHC